jgi:DDE superfamily endonuclease
VIAFRATLDVPRELVQFVARLLWAERRRRGTPKGSRALTCFWEAVLALRWFRDRTSPDALARDHGVSRATAYRYLDEVIEVLASQAPGLRQALERAKDEGFSHVILDGAIIPSDWCKEPAISVKGEVIDLWYSGKAHTHGGNIQAVTAPGGFPLWVSDVEPGSVHDLTAARAHALPALYHAAATGLPPLADPGYDGAHRHPDSRQTTRRRPGTRHQCPHPQRDPAVPALPGRTRVRPGRWRTLQHITASPSKIGAIARAALVLTHFEHGYMCRGH